SPLFAQEWSASAAPGPSRKRGAWTTSSRPKRRKSAVSSPSAHDRAAVPSAAPVDSTTWTVQNRNASDRAVFASQRTNFSAPWDRSDESQASVHVHGRIGGS